LRALPIISALLLGSACGSDVQVNRLVPNIAVAPSSLDFGPVTVGDEGILQLQVANAGTGPLTVSSISIEDPTLGETGVYTVTPPQLEVAAGDSAAVLVSFAPDDFSSFDSNVLMGTNDPEAPVVVVPVAGEGVDGGPDITVDPAALDFGTVDVGDSATAVFTVANTGEAPLHIDSDSQQDGSGAFSLVTDPRGETVDPGGSFTVLVAYAPTTDAGDAGSLQLASDDPDDPTVSVSFTGNGGAVDSYPVAVIDAYSSAHPGQTLILDGTDSYDPDGNEPLTYAWSLLDQPASSVAAISNTALSAPYMTLDVSGSYVVALQVQNTLGVASSVAVHAIEAQPEDSLYVELTWDADDADMDLHLVANDPASWFSRDDDCCWCNENPDWGTLGDGSDDPLLAADASGDGGPETILMQAPAEGEYFVRAHYFQDNGAGTAQATVKIYVAGELAGRYSQQLTHNEVWEVAYVRWPQGYVVEEGGDPYPSDERSCGL